MCVDCKTANVKKVYTYWDIVCNCKLLVFTTRIGFLWSVLPVLYYTISALTLNYSGDMYLNYFLASIPDIPAFFFTIFILIIFTISLVERKRHSSVVS